MDECNYKVYVKLDEKNIIVAIDSNVFLNDLTGWTFIDEGPHSKYARAQIDYLENGLLDEKGRYNYKYENGNVIELSEEEKEILFPSEPMEPTMQERIEALESAMIEMILGGN